MLPSILKLHARAEAEIYEIFILVRIEWLKVKSLRADLLEIDGCRTHYMGIFLVYESFLFVEKVLLLHL